MAGEVHRGLPGGVASSDEDHVPSSATASLDGRGPVGHAATLERTRELTSNLVAPDEACASWKALYLRLLQLEAELMEHIHLENNVLFRRALVD